LSARFKKKSIIGFILKECIKLIEIDSKDTYNFTKDLFFEKGVLLNILFIKES